MIYSLRDLETIMIFGRRRPGLLGKREARFLVSGGQQHLSQTS
jgi:hypothetical protein